MEGANWLDLGLTDLGKNTEESQIWLNIDQGKAKEAHTQYIQLHSVYNIIMYWFDLLEMTGLEKEVGEGQTKKVFQIFEEYFLSLIPSF